MNVADYLELYKSEAGESLQALENGLIGLESSAEPRAQIDELFRRAHNLKGISGAMGYGEVVEASHELESVFDGLRKGSAITPETLDELLASVDRLKALVGRAIGEVAGGAAVARPVSAAEAGAGPAERPVHALGERITATKVELERLDRVMDLVGELVVSRIRFSAIAEEIGSRPLLDELNRSWRLISQMQKEVMEARLIPVGQVFQRFHRLVRDLSRETGKPVKLDMNGAEIGLDRVVLEGMVDPLVHLIRNAVDHGIEPPDERRAAGKPAEARIILSASRERSHVVIEVVDDGRGIDLDGVARAASSHGAAPVRVCDLSEDEICRVITAPGFSTAEGVNTLSGRGIGMNIVKKTVDSFGGSIRIRTTPGRGTMMSLLIPVNLSIVKALLFEVNGDVHAIPIEYVKETSRCELGALKTVRGELVMPGGDEVIPVLRPAELFGIPLEVAEERYAKIIVIDTGLRRVAVIVGRIIGQQDIVIKSLPPFFRGVRGISGATVLGSGKIAFIWDPCALFEGRCAYEPNQTAVLSAS
jgi:two-component system chemotaxis sensor kinase CheA